MNMSLSPSRKWFLAAVIFYVLAIILGYFFIYGQHSFYSSEEFWPHDYFIVGQHKYVLSWITHDVLWLIIGWGPITCLLLSSILGIIAARKTGISILLKVISTVAILSVNVATQLIIIVLAIGASPRGLGGP